MRITGIDEAGYGPVLGPLVVSAVSVDLPDRLATQNLWELLNRCVTKKPRPPRSDARLSVCDSKKLHAGTNKLARLERTALAFLAHNDAATDSFDPVVNALDPEFKDRARLVPWFAQDPPSLPIAANEPELRTQRAALKSALATSGIERIRIRSVILPAVEYNRMVSATRNKASVLFWATMRLVTNVLADRDVAHQVRIDRHGGRDSYATLLMKHLDTDTLHISEENPDASRYTLTHLPNLCEISFLKKGEEREFAIALASIVSKYIRELCMHRFNRFWTQRIDDLPKTAGYYTDGMRFFNQVRPHLSRLGIAESTLLRSR